MSEIHNHENHENSKMTNEVDSVKKGERPQIEHNSDYWLTLEQYNNDPEFKSKVEEEFKSSPLREGMESEGEDGFARREFLKLMGASIALASASCVRRPVQKIVPYNKQPEEITFALPNYYTSSYFDGSEALGLLIKTREGRPIRIEGNPSHPLSLGAVSSRAQAAILNLYDPERLQKAKRNLLNEKRTNKETVDITWEDLDTKVTEQLKKGGVALLTPSYNSPSTRAVLSDFVSAFGAQHISWEPLATDDVSSGQRVSYGEEAVPFYQFDKAKLIVSIDADFLGAWGASTIYLKQFGRARKNPELMNKLVVFDSNYSLTGANADVRVKSKPSLQLDIACGLVAELVSSGKIAATEANKNLVSIGQGVAQKLGIEAALFSKIASDLWESKGKSIVVAGGLPARTEEALALQVVVNYLNSVLANDGSTILSQGLAAGYKSSYAELMQLVQNMNEGKVKTLIIHRSNPLYALPKEIGFQEALKKVEMVVYSGDRMDETASFSHIIATDNHPMENWGDAEIGRGVYSIQQPTLRPMYDTRSFQLSLMTWAYLLEKGSKRLTTYETFHDFVKAVWREEILPQTSKGKDFESAWGEALQKGFVGEMKVSTARSFKSDSLNSVKKVLGSQTGFELVLYPTVQLGDGSLANVPWLQELPDPITKIVWDNYASVSVQTAANLKLKEGQILEITVAGKKMEVPVHIQPGLHNDVLAIAVGYGRTHVGKVGNKIGFNSFELATVKNKSLVFSGLSVDVKPTKKSYELACPQGHHTMEGRQIVVEATLKDYMKQKDANIHRHKIWSLWSGHQYNGHKWGMAIDLNVCSGCSACVTACQSENNIHVVGKKYVIEGREMHWIRVDRYYTGTPENAEVVFQPMMCQHCDNAPCETVCPVLATMHSPEGLNEMIYNRCVGTRYCSNNCPYKVRRFNWFNYAKLIEKPTHMSLNPEVTVRPRGVMEKCTFCVQRIKAAKHEAKLEERKIVDGDVKTACQTSCPSEAIVFGDLNDPNSKVSQAFNIDKEPRAYAVLEEWHAAPSVRYLSKIRNNDKLTEAKHKSPGHGATDDHAMKTQNNLQGKGELV
jgi:MoCo/4Fe-4S cofactor protein with predicted Tat translocation signal